MKNNDDRDSMSLVGHLSELRTRIVVSVIAVFVCVCIAFTVSDPVLDYMTRPIRRLDREPGRDAELVLHASPDGTLRIGGQRIPGEEIDQPLDFNTLSTQRFVIVFNDAASSTNTQRSLVIGARASQGVYYRSPFDPFMVPLKVSLVVGLLMALPILLHQVWLFVKPGLRESERKIVRPLLGAALFLFPLGATFAFFMVAMIMQVMQSYSPSALEPLFGIHEYLSVLTMMMIVFGFIFELPLCIALAARVGVVTPDLLVNYRRHAYILLAVAAMVLTPADPFSMLAALVPLIILYEISLLVARPMARMHQRDLLEPDPTD